MMSDDMALVREYAQSNSEQAFATLVSRHVNLVYSVALRQVSDHHLAEEISQAVFVILARKGKSLSPKTILSGWLYRTARNISADMLKIQRRRQFREQEAHMQSTLNESGSDAWNQIAPLLDEALNCLGEKEHDAVVLRFFDGKELKQVGAAMGTTEDAARMRVNRGIDKLREFFTKKGVTLSATAIAGAVAANSVQAAPAGLAASITAAALSGTAITTTSVIAATKTIAMTTLQKAIVTATVAVLAGAGIYEVRQASITRSQLQAFQQGQIVPSDDIQKLTRERDDAAGKLLAAREENKRLTRDNAELLKLRGEVGLLRRQVAEKSEPVSIQERNATVLSNPTTQAEFETQKRQMTFALLRVGDALRQFMTNNPYGIIVDASGQPNSDIFAKLPGLPLDDLVIRVQDVQLLAHAMEQEPRRILAATKNPIFFNDCWTRSYLLADGSVASFGGGRSDEQFTAVYPPDEDLKVLMNQQQQMPEALKTIQSTMGPVLKAYSDAHPGQAPEELSLLTPYATTPEQQAALQQMLQWKRSSGSNSAPR
jgi:RNA polymerase sigma factor (sigma-70 family)